MSTFFKIFLKKVNLFCFFGMKASERPFSAKKTTIGLKHILLKLCLFVAGCYYLASLVKGCFGGNNQHFLPNKLSQISDR